MSAAHSRRSFVKRVGAAAGAVALTPSAMAEAAGQSAPQLPAETPRSVHPTLNRRARGWLRFPVGEGDHPGRLERGRHAAHVVGPLLEPGRHQLRPLRSAQLVVRPAAHGRRDAGLARGLHPDRRRARRPLPDLLGRDRLADADRRRPAAGELSRPRDGGNPGAAPRQLQPHRLDRERHRALGSLPGSDRLGRQPLLPRLVQPGVGHLPLHLGR